MNFRPRTRPAPVSLTLELNRNHLNKSIRERWFDIGGPRGISTYQFLVSDLTTTYRDMYAEADVVEFEGKRVKG